MNACPSPELLDIARHQPPPRTRPRRLAASGAASIAFAREAISTYDVTAPATPEAAQWDGWGTALKPGHEPICLARKPLDGTVAATVLKHGTGALNIDATRIGTSKDVPASPSGAGSYGGNPNGQTADDSGMNPNIGRWPANVILDPEAAAMLDEQTGELTSGKVGPEGFRGEYKADVYGRYAENRIDPATVYGDTGGASRFFYCAKVSSAERAAGLPDGNSHPTLKPINLMRWLVRLVGGQPGSVILDPFAGSGSTGIAAILEGMNFVGIEQDAEYVEIARARIAWWAEHPDGMKLVDRLEHENAAKAKSDAGQISMFDEAT
jgi:site-specific DNA-methyltransferase (adenine-specific)